MLIGTRSGGLRLGDRMSSGEARQTAGSAAPLPARASVRIRARARSMSTGDSVATTAPASTRAPTLRSRGDASADPGGYTHVGRFDIAARAGGAVRRPGSARGSDRGKQRDSGSNPVRTHRDGLLRLGARDFVAWPESTESTDACTC